MGYRSEVKICILEKDYLKMLEEGTKVPHFKDIMNLTDIYVKKKDVIIFGWNWTKWDEAFSEVEFIMNFIRSLEVYSYVRIGESCGDMEEEFYYGLEDRDYRCDLIHANSQIIMDI